ncbi:GNAT family N-acetyltransferase [Rhizobium sp. SIMBA_035]
MTGTILTTERLIIRNWREEDRELFHEINSDPDVMEFFPKRRNRAESDEFFDYAQRMIAETGLGFYALELTATGETLGFCGIVRTSHEPAIPDGTVEIGWRLAKRHWGAGYVSEAATALLKHGFENHGLKEIVAFTVPQNRRSRAVMQRIGMTHRPERDFNHPKVPDTAPQFVRHVLYAISAPERG